MMRKSAAARVVLVASTLAALASRAGADKIAELAAQLKAADYKVRLGAALALGKSADPKGASALTVALGDSNQTVRGVAAAALAKIAVKPTITPGDLKAAMVRLCTSSRSDESDFVKTQAQKAFKTILDAQPGKVPATPCGGGGAATAQPGPGGGSKYVIVVKVRDESGNASADEIAFLGREITKAIGKKSDFSAAVQTASVGKGQAGYDIEITIKKLSVKPGGSYSTIDCATGGSIWSYPANSLLAPGMPMDASVQTGKSEKMVQDGKKDCLGGLADAITDTVTKFAKSR